MKSALRAARRQKPQAPNIVPHEPCYQPRGGNGGHQTVQLDAVNGEFHGGSKADPSSRKTLCRDDSVTEETRAQEWLVRANSPITADLLRLTRRRIIFHLYLCR